jgi:hypothetical protein
MNFYSNGIPVFDLLGDGTGIWHKGGIRVEDGGITIAQGGLSVRVSAVVVVVLTAVVHRSNDYQWWYGHWHGSPTGFWP